MTRRLPAARLGLMILPAVAALLLGACLFGGGKKKTPSPTTTAGTPAAANASVVPSLTAAAAATLAPSAGTVFPTSRAVTPPPRNASPTPSAPTASPTPGIRTANGLQIQDIAFTGKIAADGGLRIRNSPTLDGQVVGSLAQDSIVNVSGKVLNGAEAEQGKGTVWYIVGINQYVYGAEGYVVPVQGAAPAGTPSR